MTVIDLIDQIVKKYPARPALTVGNRTWTYAEFWGAANWVSCNITSTGAPVNGPIAVFASRSFQTYASILGILLSGFPYLPMNSKYPLERIKKLLVITGCTVAVCDSGFVSNYGSELDAIFCDLGIRKIDVSDVSTTTDLQLKARSEHTKYSKGVELPPIDAYVLFTSGTTGDPKGIVVSHQNLFAYVDYVMKKYPLSPEDRCSQAFDTTFDPSAHDMFVTWSSGACLCVPGVNDLLLPNVFINKYKLTVWYSVPSIALRMKQRGMLRNNSFPFLRYSIFSGEALPDHLASSWQSAAPASRLVNYYGPTEVTINITDYEWSRETSSKIARNGIVPIGKVFGNHLYLIVDDAMKPVPPGEIGELVVAGPQVTRGYLNSSEKTKENYINISDRDEVWYRTGDLVAELQDHTIQYIGRSDQQMKIRGYRVELGEIEEVIRNVDGITEAVVLPLIGETGVSDTVVAFVLSEKGETVCREAIDLCRKLLPEYMVPSRVLKIDSFPLSPTGKTDRTKLKEWAER